MTHPEQDDPQHAAADTAFIDALIRGDELAARAALASGADVNATDPAGRSSLACALTGEDWENADCSDASFVEKRAGVVRLVVTHPQVSLYTLNAPQDEMQGVTPLCVAAWLNAVDAVRICLEAGAGAVAVDVPDAQGNATPLMYAARDGRTELVEVLLAYGAHPESRDNTCRSSLQYALPHAETLWRCENAVRAARIREFLTGNARRLPFPPDAFPSSSTSSVTDAPSLPAAPSSQLLSHTNTLSSTSEIVKCVRSSDVQTLWTLLFPSHVPNDRPPAPYLVNRADIQNWSPVHYCCSIENPSIEVLDALFLAGAEVGLLTQTANLTPLHCIARKHHGVDALRDASINARLYDFVTHLVRDLGAPLAARSTSRDTCIHMAAEHGDSAEVLRALLDCDEDRTVRELKNCRGLTALEVAKPEFRVIFGVQAESLRSGSSASHMTVTPLRLRHVASTPSIQSDKSVSLGFSQLPAGSISETVDTEADSVTTPLTPALLALRWISSQLVLSAETQTVDLDHLDVRLRDARDRTQSAFAIFLANVQELTDRLARANTRWNECSTHFDLLQRALEEKLKTKPEPEFVGRSRSGTTFSSDSQVTAVSVSVLAYENEAAAFGFPSLPSSEASSRPSTPYGRLKNHKSMSDLTNSEKALPPSPTPSDHDIQATPGSRRARAGTLVGVVRPATDTEKGTLTAKKLKAWFKKKLMLDRPTAPSKTRPSIEEPRASLSTLCEAQEEEFKTDVNHPSLHTLNVVHHDLARMSDCVRGVERKLQAAARAIARAERLARRALDRRAGHLNEHRLARRVDAGLQAILDWEPGTSPTRPSPLRVDVASVASVSSAPSPVDAMPSSQTRITESGHIALEEDDTVLLERIVWWKVHERTENAEDEAERIEVWLRIVDEVLRGVQEREGLAI